MREQKPPAFVAKILRAKAMMKKTTVVRGDRVTVYSCDGTRWFSDRREAEECEKRRQQFLREPLQIPRLRNR